ncbi:NADH-quinone oxidoreductase subunit NuoE family protein [Caproicibacter fermentans]|uniref:NAD(P)H-dependent oxidoreductase subunit E n=1 Tax=Caproicibacter fermentans TaxID=2576756 RepID=A0A7G8T8H7_9FIRM|nr:NAD(P)H-dependent oxidoreductase subunit E [Caproicibacter fermentans]QNK39918.1 NAD(P)H-dependent oxidoreductase subunit E [Caproicibacter fermentans]
MAEITRELSTEQIQQLDSLIECYGREPGGLIPLLEKSQNLLGYLPVSVQRRISEKTGIAPNKIYGVISFYSFFTMHPKARHRVQVCMGTACYVKGSQKLADKIESDYHIKVGDSTKDGRFSYEKTRCFGACGQAPVMVVDGKVYGKVTVDAVDDILNQYK